MFVCVCVCVIFSSSFDLASGYILKVGENLKRNWNFEEKMKIQCDVCERAPATVICCADEAALCAKCDVEVHAANKLASKHQRLLLQCLSNKLPPCDICQVLSPSSSLSLSLSFFPYFFGLNGLI